MYNTTNQSLYTLQNSYSHIDTQNELSLILELSSEMLQRFSDFQEKPTKLYILTVRKHQ